MTYYDKIPQKFIEDEKISKWIELFIANTKGVEKRFIPEQDITYGAQVSETEEHYLTFNDDMFHYISVVETTNMTSKICYYLSDNHQIYVDAKTSFDKDLNFVSLRNQETYINGELIRKETVEGFETKNELNIQLVKTKNFINNEETYKILLNYTKIELDLKTYNYYSENLKYDFTDKDQTHIKKNIDFLLDKVDNKEKILTKSVPNYN